MNKAGFIKNANAGMSNLKFIIIFICNFSVFFAIFVKNYSVSKLKMNIFFDESLKMSKNFEQFLVNNWVVAHCAKFFGKNFWQP